MYDDLDAEHAGASWLGEKRNSTLLDVALLDWIRQRPELRKAYVETDEDGKPKICVKAAELYESYAQL